MISRTSAFIENGSERSHGDFDQWGALTGAETLEGYVQILQQAVHGDDIPVLVALDDSGPLGSASLVACEMTIRAELTLWLAQLFVKPVKRGCGIGAALVNAVALKARRCGFGRLYLYTSGDLPRYCGRPGWVAREQVADLGKERVVMELGR